MLLEQAIRAAVLSEYHNLAVSVRVCMCVCMCVCVYVCVCEQNGCNRSV